MDEHRTELVESARCVLGVAELLGQGQRLGGERGTDRTRLDRRESYRFYLRGQAAAQPQQGIHVRLTVTTPGARGNDTKSKVFWVEDCQPEVE